MAAGKVQRCEHLGERKTFARNVAALALFASYCTVASRRYQQLLVHRKQAAAAANAVVSRIHLDSQAHAALL